MPSRRVTAAAVANAKKTLSDSEVLAYSKNRFVEHNLRQKVQHLSDQEHVYQDRLQKEMVRWKQFIRQSSRTTGVWSTELDSTEAADSSQEIEEGEGTQDARQQGEDLKSPGQRPPHPPPPSARSNPSTELVRSLTFQSEAMSQLQKPWVYTYCELSHNTIHKDALEASKVKAKRLLFKRAASAPGNRSTSDPLKGFRAAPTPLSPYRADVRSQGGRMDTRPVTGRSTPGVPHKSARTFPNRLAASAAAVANTNRPKTSVGVVRLTNHRPQKVAWTDKDQPRVNSRQLNDISLDKDQPRVNSRQLKDISLDKDQPPVNSRQVNDISHDKDQPRVDSRQVNDISLDKDQPRRNRRQLTSINRDRDEPRVSIRQLNIIRLDEHFTTTELKSPDICHVPQDTTPIPHVTTVFKFTDNGGSVEISPPKEKKPTEVKLPTLKKRKQGMVLNMEQVSQENITNDSFTKREDETDAVDVCSNLTHDTRDTNGYQQTDGEQENQERSAAQASDVAAGQRGTPQTPDESNASREEEVITRPQSRFEVWKWTDSTQSVNGDKSSNSNGSLPQLGVSPPETEGQVSSEQSVTQIHDTNLTETAKSPSSPHSSSESHAEDHVDKNRTSKNKTKKNKPANRKDESIKAENQEDGNPSDSTPDKDRKSSSQVTTSTSTTTTTSRPSDPKAKPSGPGQRLNGSSESPLAGIHSVPIAHSALGKRRSFMKIVEQLEALRAGNHRRSVRVDSDTDICPLPEEKEAKEADTKPDNDSTNSATNGESTTTETDTKTKVRHRFAKLKSALKLLKNHPETQAENQPPSHQTEKTEVTTHTDKPISNDPESQPTEVHTLTLEESTMIGTHPVNSPRSDAGTEMALYASDMRSLADSEATTFNGYRIRNYVRPQHRYRMDPFLSNRREKSLLRLSIEYPVYLNGYRGDFKSQMLFPKTCRQKVLQELVQRNHRPPPVQGVGVVPPELRAKIDDFFKTIEDYCPKPEIILDH
ncbi:hypothetical protein ACOMHN_025450 [Nucella lapillus]